MAATSLGYQFKTANIAIKLIVINVVVFLLFNLIPWIVQIDNIVLTQWFFLPSDISNFITQPWSLITYNFLHRDVWHLLWNMLYLYIFSRFILNLFTDKRLLTVYLLGGMVGGLLFVAAYNVLPAFQGKGYLIGASAAVNAIIVFIAAYTPKQSIRIIMFNVKLWQIAVVLVLIDLLSLPTSGNAGGLMAHLGGAGFGYIYAIQLAKGNDIGAWFERFMDSVASMFSGKPKEKKSRMRTVHRNTKTTAKPTQKKSEGKSSKQQQIDAILDKISKSGYDSLSKSEKDFLFKAGKD